MLFRSADLLQRQGRLAEAQRLVRESPASDQPEPRARLLAEVQVLRNARQWQAAYDLLLPAMRQSPDDSGLVYELAMTAERLRRYDDMEVLLHRAMQLKPEDAQAYNALGYSLAERGLRLDEAAELIGKARQLAPDDPYIADSLGWVYFQRGQRQDALAILQQAFAYRPHPEVAAHLGEVLWAEIGRAHV